MRVWMKVHSMLALDALHYCYELHEEKCLELELCLR